MFARRRPRLSIVLALSVTACGGRTETGLTDAGGWEGDNSARDGIVTSLNYCAVGLAAGANSLYWIDTTSTLVTVPLKGGTPSTMGTVPLIAIELPHAMSADEHYVYVVTGQSLVRVPQIGGASETIASATEDLTALADTTDDVYVANANEVIAVSKTEATRRSIGRASAPPVAIAVDPADATVYWLTARGAVEARKPGAMARTIVAPRVGRVQPVRDSYPGLIAYNGTVVWTDLFSQAALSITNTGGAAHRVSATSAQFLQREGGQLYWSGCTEPHTWWPCMTQWDSTNTVFTAPLGAEGAAIEAFATPAATSELVALTVKTGYVYWSEVTLINRHLAAYSIRWSKTQSAP